MLQEEIRHKKSDIRLLNKEFNSIHSSMQKKTTFIEFLYRGSLFLRTNNRILESKSAMQQKKLSKLVKPNSLVQDSGKVIFRSMTVLL